MIRNVFKREPRVTLTASEAERAAYALRCLAAHTEDRVDKFKAALLANAIERRAS